MMSNSTGYGPRSPIFDGDERKFELWELKFLGYLRIKKLLDVINPIPLADGSLPNLDADKNADVYAELVQCLDDKSLTLIMRDAPNDGKLALNILREHYLGNSKQRVIALYT